MHLLHVRCSRITFEPGSVVEYKGKIIMTEQMRDIHLRYIEIFPTCSEINNYLNDMQGFHNLLTRVDSRFSKLHFNVSIESPFLSLKTVITTRFNVLDERFDLIKIRVTELLRYCVDAKGKKT